MESTRQHPVPAMAATRDLDSLVRRVASGEVLPGVRRCLLRVDGPAVGGAWTAAAGVDDPRGPTMLRPAAPFRAASITKVVTAATVLALGERGAWALDDPVGRFLPVDLVERVHVLGGRSFGHEITLRQCLDHTSGLADSFAHPAVQLAIREGSGGRRFTPLDLVALAIHGGLPSFAPGLGRQYTDTGFVLAGIAIERLTGRALHDAYREFVLGPAGMERTWLESGDDRPTVADDARVTRHQLDGVDVTDLDPTVDWAAGGLVTTAGDLVSLLRALGDGVIVGPRSWREMTTWAPGPVGYYDDYGLGLGRYRMPNVELIGHHGVWGAFAFWTPELDAIVSGTVNAGCIDRRPLLSHVVEILQAHPG